METGLIIVDSRTGSQELAAPLRAKAPCPVIVRDLPSGDFTFTGYLEQSLVSVGIERKTLSDLLASLYSGRLTGFQAPRMREYHDISYLIVESTFRANPETGYLEEASRGGWGPPRGGRGRRNILYEEIDHFLNSVTILAHVHILRCSSQRQTVASVINLWSWFQKEDHKSFKQFHRPPPPTALLYEPEEADTDEYRAYILRMMVKELPGIGWERSQMVVEHFGGSFNQMAAAGTDGWRIQGEQSRPGIGPGTVKRVMNALHRRRDAGY